LRELAGHDADFQTAAAQTLWDFSGQLQHLIAKVLGKPESCFSLQLIEGEVSVTTITRFVRNELRQGLAPPFQG
jgi:hypothetical protein